MSKNSWKRAAAVIILTAVIFSMTACSSEPKVKTEVYTDLFDTVTVISGYGKSDEGFSADCELIYGEMLRLNREFDIYHTYEGTDNLRSINDDTARGAGSKASPEVLGLLEFAKEMYDATGGLVNAAYGSVTGIWHDLREAAEKGESVVLPTDEELEAAAEHCDFDSVLIDEENGTVAIADQGLLLDVGALAKGYVCRYLSGYLKEKGITGYVISLGGNVLTVGVKPGQGNWTIAVENPGIGTSAYLMTLSVGADMSVVSSGAYQRYFEIDGVRYHHIIDPDTHRPEDRYLMVTVIGPDSAVCDALSTALFNADEDRAMELIGTFDGFEAALVHIDGSAVYSSGFESYVLETVL